MGKSKEDQALKRIYIILYNFFSKCSVCNQLQLSLAFNKHLYIFLRFSSTLAKSIALAVYQLINSTKVLLSSRFFCAQSFKSILLAGMLLNPTRANQSSQAHSNSTACLSASIFCILVSVKNFNAIQQIDILVGLMQSNRQNQALCDG